MRVDEVHACRAASENFQHTSMKSIFLQSDISTHTQPQSSNLHVHKSLIGTDYTKVLGVELMRLSRYNHGCLRLYHYSSHSQMKQKSGAC